MAAAAEVVVVIEMTGLAMGTGMSLGMVIYVEDGWVGGGSPSPIRYARPDSRGSLSSDGEGPGRVKETGDESAASSEVEFADVDGDSNDSDEDYSERKLRKRRGWRVDGGRGADNTPSMTTSSPALSLSIPQFARAQPLASSHHSSHPSSPSNPSASSPLSSSSSSSSTYSYSNPYSTRKDRKRARKTHLR